MMKRIVVFLAVLNILIAASAQAAPVTAMVSYAEWCGPCQILRPKLERAVAELGGNEVKIVYIDFTDVSAENFKLQFERAKPLRPSDFMVDGRFVRTGFAHVLARGRKVSTISAGLSVEDMKAIIEKARSAP